MPCCSNSPVWEITVYFWDGTLETEMSICSVILRSQTSFLIDCISYSSRRLRRLFKLFLTHLRSLQLIVNFVCFVGIAKPRQRSSLAWMKLTTVFVSAPLQYAPYPYTRRRRRKDESIAIFRISGQSFRSFEWYRIFIVSQGLIIFPDDGLSYNCITSCVTIFSGFSVGRCVC